MGADLSRVRFDARRDHAGVVLQQGRLLLDAEWNELVAILERRLRANAADLGSPGPKPGIQGVAVVPRTTKDAFRVTLDGGQLTIGRGRMYVDGLLAENHGGAPSPDMDIVIAEYVGPAQEFDPILAEPVGTTDLDYFEQPYLPDPPMLPTSGDYLAYLDVWQREVTHLEAPDLVEPAVGVDTTARIQTVWQVRLHPLGATGGAGRGDVTCSTPDAEIPNNWSTLIVPSGGRLTAEAITVGDADEPCELPPTGGYRGLEHQTYRIEIHAGGAPGTATFKWSRDNGSVASPVLEVLSAGTVVRPASLGKDAVLGFHDGDWVEVTDDHREFAQVPGAMARIEVHDENGTVTVSPALPTDLRLDAADAAERHLRIRRWDESGAVKSAAGATLVNLDAPASTGLIGVPALSTTKVVLEHGLVVSFRSTGAPFRTGDHWIVAARAADAAGASLDDGPLLDDAPPLGIHHHYARLGILNFTDDDETDCRTLWPPECDCEGGGCSDCTICVTPASHESGELTIQMAVDLAQEEGGGTVCLAGGSYPLDAPVEITGASSIRVRGQGLRTLVIASGSAFHVEGSAFVTIEDLTVFASGQAPGIELRTTAVATVKRCTVLMLAGPDLPAPGIALAGVALRTALRDNVVIAATGIGVGGGEETFPLLTAELELRDNLILARDLGVALQGPVAHLLGNRVESNTVLRAEGAGLRLLGAVAPNGAVVVAQNALLIGGWGIEVGPSGHEVSGNDVSGTPMSLELVRAGIVVRPSPISKVPGSVRVDANRIRDVGGAGILVRALVDTLDVVDNRVERALHGLNAVDRGRARVATVSRNTVTDVASRESDPADDPAGLRIVGADRATVEQNTVRGVGTGRETGGEAVGIDVLACAESRVAGNTVDRIGFAPSGGLDLGIAVRGRIRRCQVDGNQARRQPVDPEADGPSGFRGLLVGADEHPEEPGFTVVRDWVFGTGAATFVVGAMDALEGRILVDWPPTVAVTVDANVIAGSGELPTALVGVGGDAVVTSNQFHGRFDGGAPALRVLARSATVGQNRLRGGSPSAQLEVNPERLAVLGNLSTTPIEVFGGGLDSHWAQLNPFGF